MTPRAPSAFLDDLFDDAGGAPGHGHSPLGRDNHSPHGAPF